MHGVARLSTREGRIAAKPRFRVKHGSGGTTIRDTPTLNWLLGTAAFVVVVAGMRAAHSLVVPFMLASFLAIVCTPPLEWLRRRGLPTPLALALVLSAASSVFLTVAVVAWASIIEFIGNADALQSEFGAIRAEILENMHPAEAVEADDGAIDSEATDLPALSRDEPDVQVERANDDDPTLIDPRAPIPIDGEVDAAEDDPDQLPDQLDDGGIRGATKDLKDFLTTVIVPGKIFGFFVGFAASLGSLLGNVFLVLVTLAMILLEASGFPAKMLALFHGEPVGLKQAERIRDAVIHYISIKSWVSLIVGVGIAAWTQLLGVPHPVLWGILGFFFNFVPNIGSIIAAIPAVLVAFVHGEPPNWSLALWTAGGYTVVNCVVGYAVEPRLMGRGLGLSTLVVFMSLVFWGWVLGPVGMLLSVPLTMIAKIVLDAAPETRWVGILLSADPTAANELDAAANKQHPTRTF